MRTVLQGNSEEEKKSSSPPTSYNFDFDNEYKNISSMMLNNSSSNDKPPPPQAQPATAAVNNLHWDVEEDHLLSYFLGANEGVSPNNPPLEPHQQPPVVNMEPTSILRSSSHSSPNIGGSSLDNFVHSRARESSDGLTSIASSVSMSNPPTHSVSFMDQQRPGQSSQHSSQASMHRVPSRASSENSSSSSLATMAAALALGGPNQVLYMQQKLQNRDQLNGHQMNNMSPITPVNMLGSPSGYENMMLPPPPRFPNGHPQNNMMQQQQQQMMMSNLQHQQQQQMMPQVVGSSMSNPQTATNGTKQQPNFLPQMSPLPNPQPSFTVSALMQPQQHVHKGGFPTPSSITSSMLGQPHQPHMHQQPMGQPQPQQQQAQQSQQIQIGMGGQNIPITAIPTENGQVVYQIDPSVVPTAGLRYFTKAINEVSKPEEKKDVDPQVLAKKRAERLARNRESARNSRRRKKEHLQTMGDKVKNLQGQVDSEVRNKVNTMEDGLMKQRDAMMERWLAEHEGKESPDNGDKKVDENDECRKQLAIVLQKTGVNCSIRRAVIAHQYNFLRQTFLSPHNHFSVWMMMQSANFFTEASRQQQANIVSGALPSTKTSSRANSKQIGEEIYNEQKERLGSVTSNVNDQLKMWPLYCYEITMTMEQEERIINQAHAQAKNTPNLQKNLVKIKVATDATRHLQNAMQCHTQLAAQRNEKLLLDILTPQQAVLFKQWFQKNKDRCKVLMEKELRAASSSSDSPGGGNVQSESMPRGVLKQLEDLRLR